MANDLMFQCDLTNGTARTHGYIEQRGAKVGNRVSLKDSDDPSVMWTVTSVASTGISAKYLKEMEVANRRQREASDI